MDMPPDSAIGSSLSLVSDAHSVDLDQHWEEYKYENDRRYHASCARHKYPLPNDEKEEDRLNGLHDIIVENVGLYMAPIPIDIQSVLDVGTGTGTWVIDFADQTPSAAVIGLDISPIQPNIVPRNCKFYVDDVEADQSLWPEPQDYIHLRSMLFSIHNWFSFFRRAFDVLQPGGYIEIQHFDFPPTYDDESAATSIILWSRSLIEGAEMCGIDLNATQKIPGLLREIGFEGIETRIDSWPIGVWNKQKEDLGSRVQQNFEQGLEAFSLRLLNTLGWAKEEIVVLLAKVRNEIRAQKPLFSVDLHTTWARKPPQEDDCSTNNQ
jgi:SAM-dependent methyltransferase